MVAPDEAIFHDALIAENDLAKHGLVLDHGRRELHYDPSKWPAANLRCRVAAALEERIANDSVSALNVQVSGHLVTSGIVACGTV